LEIHSPQKVKINGEKKEKRGDEKRGKEDEKGIMTPGGKEDKIG